LRGAEAIRAYWSNLPPARSDIRFAYELLAVTEQWGMAHWHGSYTPVDRATRLELDGILLVSLDDDGRCEDFREWSNRRQVAVPPATGRAAVAPRQARGHPEAPGNSLTDSDGHPAGSVSSASIR
jgi:hypothetical protein